MPRKKTRESIPCSALNKHGEPCGCWAVDTEEGLCFMHSKKLAKERKRAQVYGGTQSAKRKSLLMVEKVTGELVTLDDIEPVAIEDLADLTQYALDKMTAIEARSHDGDISTRDSAELRKWAEFLLRVQVVGGLGAEDRIRQLETLVSQLDGATRKLLPAPQHEED